MAAEQMPLLDEKLPSPIPAAPFASALARPRPSPGTGARPPLPQNIAHRGYKAAFPENSMAAFRGAVDAGAHAIETDLHLSRDGVVVLSTLKTLREPRQGMPRLVDLLSWLAQPDLESTWLLLDIKIDDDADALISATAEAIASVPPAPSRPWNERIVLGAWNENYIRLCRLHLPDFPLALISFTTLYARRVLDNDGADYAGVDFNMFQPSLVGPVGASFRAAARRAGRRLFAWTVNDDAWMAWCVRKAVDGVITDDPRLFGEVCERFAAGEEAGSSGVGSCDGLVRSARLYARALLLQMATIVALVLMWHRLASRGASHVRSQALLPRPREGEKARPRLLLQHMPLKA